MTNELSRDRQASKVHERLTTRRNILKLALGAGALGAIYAIDKTDAVVRFEESVNPFDSEQKYLTPESYEVNIPWLSETVQRWEGIINEMSEEYQIDPEFVAIIMTIESGGYTKAESEADAKGLMQITPLAETDIVTRLLHDPIGEYDIWDPRTNIEFGVAYLAYLRDEYHEDYVDVNPIEFIAAGYNGGLGAARSLANGKGLASEQTLQHSRDSLNMWRERKAVSSPTYNRWLERGGSGLIAQAAAE